MSRKTRGRIRMLLAVPSAAVLMLGASQALASPPPPPPDDCRAYCEGHWQYCAANPSTFSCRFCGCNIE